MKNSISTNPSSLLRWEIAGIIALVVIILSLPVYVLKMAHKAGLPNQTVQASSAAFAGSRKCLDCHKREYDRWQGSHHDHAMEVAGADTVLGNFDNAVFEHHGISSRFYRKDDKFFVYTQGPGGGMGDFEITHTFGWYPLQQYLVPFPEGRFQCLPIAWDVEKKKWYHLYPDEPLDPGDWLYWTNNGQNWNGMCAECHSTNLKKNYDLKTDTYRTTWSDIDVGCEACHGPGSRHLAWAEMPDMARPQVENYDLAVQTSGLGSRDLVELCAPCHARRAALGDYTHSEPDLLDSLLPTLLIEGMYFPDGQILDEVYVYGSFTQSKMYHRDVHCSDCHDVHSIKPLKEGNALCLQCHRASEYDTKAHHFHKQKGEEGKPVRNAEGEILFDVGTGAECVQCHMPGRTYMGIDYRPDHGFRIPRPDLSVALDTPNACNRCHIRKTAQWSDETLTKWYGPGRRTHYGTIVEAGRKRAPEAEKNLIRLAGDPLYPVIVRATALTLLEAYPGDETTRTFETALMDDEALIRRTAVDLLHVQDQGKLIDLIAPMLYDPVKAVRIEAARRLAGEPSERLRPDHRKVFESALQEYIAAMEFSADFSFGRFNLGNLYGGLNRPEEAVLNYEAAIEIDDLFYPAKVNLAMLHNQRGEKDKAETLLRDAVKAYPDLYEAAYSLGLLLAETEQYTEAVIFLEQAAGGLPKRARIHYNLGLILQVLKRDEESETSLQRSLELEPANLDFLYALADHYIKRGRFEKARPIAEQMVSKYPDQRVGHDILRFLEKMRNPGES